MATYFVVLICKMCSNVYTRDMSYEGNENTLFFFKAWRVCVWRVVIWTASARKTILILIYVYLCQPFSFNKSCSSPCRTIHPLPFRRHHKEITAIGSGQIVGLCSVAYPTGLKIIPYNDEASSRLLVVMRIRYVLRTKPCFASQCITGDQEAAHIHTHRHTNGHTDTRTSKLCNNTVESYLA